MLTTQPPLELLKSSLIIDPLYCYTKSDCEVQEYPELGWRYFSLINKSILDSRIKEMIDYTNLGRENGLLVDAVECHLKEGVSLYRYNGTRNAKFGLHLNAIREMDQRGVLFEFDQLPKGQVEIVEDIHSQLIFQPNQYFPEKAFWIINYSENILSFRGNKKEKYQFQSGCTYDFISIGNYGRNGVPLNE